MNTYSTALVEYDQAVSSSSARSDIYTSTGGLSVNRFFDGSLEGGSTHTFQYAVYSTEQFRSGTRSMAASAAATAPRTTVSLQANQTYTLSAYVNLEETTGATTGGGAYLELISPQGVSVTSQKLLTKTGSADKWQRLFVTFTAAETGNYTLYLRCRGHVPDMCILMTCNWKPERSPEAIPIFPTAPLPNRTAGPFRTAK